MISFIVGDLFLCFLSVFLMADNVAARIAACVLVAFSDNPYRVTASYTKKYDEQIGPDTVYNYNCYN